jgi:hypothetical protein
MAPIILRAFRVIAIYQEKKTFLYYLRNRYVTIGLLILCTGIAFATIFGHSEQQRNEDGQCLLFYHYYYLLSVFALFLLLMSLVSYQIYSIHDTFHVSTELFGHLILGFISGFIYCFFVLLIYLDLISMKLTTHFIRPNYYISLYGAIGMYLSFIRPMQASFYRTNELLDHSSHMPIDEELIEDHKANQSRGSLLNLTSSRPSSASISLLLSSPQTTGRIHSSTTNPISDSPSQQRNSPPNTHHLSSTSISGEASGAGAGVLLISSLHRLTYTELMKTSVDDLLHNQETRIGLQTVARNALCPELISFLLEIQEYQQQVDQSNLQSSSLQYPSSLPTIPQAQEEDKDYPNPSTERESRSHSSYVPPSTTPTNSSLLPNPDLLPLPPPPQQTQVRSSRSNSLFVAFTSSHLSFSATAHSSHRPRHSSSFSLYTNQTTPPPLPSTSASFHQRSTASPEFELLYQRYLGILENYIEDNALQEVNISMPARHSANEIKLKHLFFQSSSEKIRGIFEMPVREVQSVIRNNLYGDLRRYVQAQYQSLQQQVQQQQPLSP